MAHKIEIRDRQASPNMAWHGLTTICNPVTKECAFPWEVEAVKVHLPDGSPLVLSEDGKRKNVQILVASDDGKPIGLPFTESYVYNTTQRFWDTIHSALEGVPFTVESAGSLKNRSRIFASVKVADDWKIGEREFKDFLSFLDSFDKSISYESHYSSHCIVCANTAAMSIQDAINRLAKGNPNAFRSKARHSKNFTSNVDKVKQAVEDFIGVRSLFKTALEEFASKPITSVKARETFMGFVADEKTEEASTRAINTVERLSELFAGGKGNSGKTRLDAFSAVTDFYSHESSGGENKIKQWESSEFGSGRRKKEEFFDLLSGSENRLKEVQKRGAMLLN